MMFGSVGMPEMIVVLVIAMIVFGPGKLPELGSMIGRAIRDFKKEMDAPREKLDMGESGRGEGKKNDR